MLAELKANLIKKCAVKPGQLLIAAVSGGRDSVALLHGLRQLQQELGIDLVAAHFNHSLRGAEADQDESFVQQLCARLAVPCQSVKMPIADLAKGQNVEACGRQHRYQWLNQVGEALAPGNYRIATAHHQQDQAETVLLHLLRGAGPQGLAAMNWQSGCIIRPLLQTPRKKIEAYLAANQLDWREDESNASAAYTRNKIRLQLWQQLLEINPNLAATLSGTADICRADEECLQQLAAAAFQQLAQPAPLGVTFGWTALMQQPLALCRRLVRLAWQQAVDTESAGWTPVSLTLQHTEAVLQLAEKKRISLPLGVYALRRQGRLYIGKKKPEAATVTGLAALPVQMGERTLQPLGWRVRVCPCLPPQLPLQPQNRGDKLVLPNQALPFLVWRTRQSGDFIRPYGMVGSKKLKNFLIDQKLPQEQRDSLLLLCQGQEVLWVPCLRAGGIERLFCEPTEDYVEITAEKLQV